MHLVILKKGEPLVNLLDRYTYQPVDGDLTSLIIIANVVTLLLFIGPTIAFLATVLWQERHPKSAGPPSVVPLPSTKAPVANKEDREKKAA